MPVTRGDHCTTARPDVFSELPRDIGHAAEAGKVVDVDALHAVTLALQDSLLLDGSIRDNIHMGKLDASDQRSKRLHAISRSMTRSSRCPYLFNVIKDFGIW